MYLNQIQPNDRKKLNKLNAYLKENFKIHVDIDGVLEDLQNLRESTKADIRELKYVHGCTSKDSDLTKSLAILEAVDIIISSKRALKENSFENDYEDYEEKIEELAKVVAKYVRLGDDLDFAISVAMREYRGSKFLRADYDVERDLREKVKGSLIASKADKRRAKEQEVEEGGDFFHPDTEHGATNYHRNQHKKPSAASLAAKDIPTAYTSRGQKAIFAPRDSGRDTTPANGARKRINMGESYDPEYDTRSSEEIDIVKRALVDGSKKGRISVSDVYGEDLYLEYQGKRWVDSSTGDDFSTAEVFELLQPSQGRLVWNY